MGIIQRCQCSGLWWHRNLCSLLKFAILVSNSNLKIADNRKLDSRLSFFSSPQCCNVEQKMNTLVKSPIAENGRITNDRIVILDAGAQYAKVNNLEARLVTYYSIDCYWFLGNRSQNTRASSRIRDFALRHISPAHQRARLQGNRHLRRTQLCVRHRRAKVWSRHFQAWFANFGWVHWIGRKYESTLTCDSPRNLLRPSGG